MKRLSLYLTCCILILLIVTTARAATYQIRELAVALQGNAGLPCMGVANGIGNSEHVAGVVYEDGAPCAAMTNDAGELVPFDGGFALGVNASGHAVGYAGSATTWDAAGNKTILPLPTGTSFSLARAINDGDQIVGECWMGSSQVSNYITLWNPGADPIVLGEGCGNAINSNGGIAGSTKDEGGAHRAFCWTSGGGMMTLAGGLSSEGVGLNNAGEVVGSIVDSAGTWACVWNAEGTLSLLTNLPGTLSSTAGAINSSGTIVGTCNTTAGSFAVLWQPDGSIVSLGELPGHSGSAAYGISDDGWIAGCSLDSAGSPHPVLWVPTLPEPAGVLALAMGVIGVVPVLRKR